MSQRSRLSRETDCDHAISLSVDRLALEGGRSCSVASGAIATSHEVRTDAGFKALTLIADMDTIRVLRYENIVLAYEVALQAVLRPRRGQLGWARLPADV